MGETPDTEANELERWKRNEDRREEILRIQHEETLALHADFTVRGERIRQYENARLADLLDVVRHRKDVIAAIDKQTAALERIATALERARL